MQSSPTKRLVVLGYFALLFLLSAWRGWNAHKIASTPVECTEAPCDAGVDYAALGMAAGTWGFLGAFFGGVILFLVVWGVYKAVAGRKPPAG